MAAIVTLVLILVIIAVAVVFVRDAKRVQAQRGQDGARPVEPSTPAPPPEPPPAPPVDAEAVLEHARELRRAVDDGLVAREEAVASIVRQAGGGIDEETAARLLDDETPD